MQRRNPASVDVNIDWFYAYNTFVLSYLGDTSSKVPMSALASSNACRMAETRARLDSIQV
jgi:hypothetical protein